VLNPVDYGYKIEIVKLSEEDGGGYLSTVPSLPGCMSDGETPQEALESVNDAIKCWIETANELGREIPSPEEYKSNNDYSGKLSLRIPKYLHKKVAERAEEENCSINQLIHCYISMGIGYDIGKTQTTINIEYKDDKLEEIADGVMRDVWETKKGRDNQFKVIDFYNNNISNVR